jgi:hypothetical protein
MKSMFIMLAILTAACGEDGATREARRLDSSTSGSNSASIRLSLFEAVFLICEKDPADGICVNLDRWCAAIATDTEAEWCPKWEAVKKAHQAE